MSESTDRPPSDPVEDGDEVEVEILEVVGLDEDSAPSSASDEVEIVLDRSQGAAEAPSDLGRRGEEDALRERLLRLRADFENFKKRVAREEQEFARQAAGRLVVALLPVVDNLERAIAAGRSESSDESLRAGIEMIHGQLLEALRREGVRPVDALGCPFDPNEHEAVATDDSTGLPPQTIVEEVQKGYRLHERLLRPALVRVSVPPGGAASAPPPGEEE